LGFSISRDALQQPYKSKEDFQKSNPKWQTEYNKPM